MCSFRDHILFETAPIAHIFRAPDRAQTEMSHSCLPRFRSQLKRSKFRQHPDRTEEMPAGRRTLADRSPGRPAVRIFSACQMLKSEPKSQTKHKQLRV